jgi:hypothetical protein
MAQRAGDGGVEVILMGWDWGDSSRRLDRTGGRRKSVRRWMMAEDEGDSDEKWMYILKKRKRGGMDGLRSRRREGN